MELISRTHSRMHASILLRAHTCTMHVHFAEMWQAPHLDVLASKCFCVFVQHRNLQTAALEEHVQT